MKTYLLEMQKGLHAQLKVISAVKGVSMKDFILEAIQEKLQRESK